MTFAKGKKEVSLILKLEKRCASLSCYLFVSCLFSVISRCTPPRPLLPYPRQNQNWKSVVRVSLVIYLYLVFSRSLVAVLLLGLCFHYLDKISVFSVRWFWEPFFLQVV